MKINIKQLLIYLAIAFVLVSIWKQPDQSARSASDFLGGIGSFVGQLVDKSATFVKGLFKS